MTDARERLTGALADRYRIERELGAGGMATVYLAEDVKHDRKVAVKVLKPELTAVLGADRFIQEIKTTASLQHPHILPLFDSGSAEGFLFYVMPYIEGETLRDKLDRETQFGIDEAVRITREVADALDYAHRHGIIHRDIKPENILLHDGRPVVADFGIALAVSAAAGGRMTETGTSVGTPHYMSPEQATGDKQITGRADIYSLASVLYEMLAGEPPHTGGSAQAVIMKIIAEPVKPVDALRKSVPPNVTAAVMQALEKLPADRFEGAKDFAAALSDPHYRNAAVARAGVGQGRIRGVPVSVFVLVIALCAVVAAAAWFRTSADPEPHFVRMTQSLPEGGQLGKIAVSMDGTKVLFHDWASGRLYIRALEEDSLRLVHEGGSAAVFSPSGTELLVGGGTLRRIPLGPGSSHELSTAGPFSSFMWGDDGFIYFHQEDGLARLPENGGPAETVVSGPSSLWPEAVLPGGRALIATQVRDRGTHVLLIDTESWNRQELFRVDGGTRVLYSSTGHLVYEERNRVLARKFDPVRRVVGDAVLTVAEGPEFSEVELGLGGTTLVYSFAVGGDVAPMIVDRQGRRRPLTNLPAGGFGQPSLSPDGERIAMLRSLPNDPGADVWVYELPVGPPVPLTRTGDVRHVGWTTDGERVAYVRGADLFSRRFDGTGDEQHLLGRQSPLSSFAFHPDGQRVVFQETPGAWDIGIATIGATDGDSLLFDSESWEGMPAISPDGQWLAYYSNDSGPPQIYVQPMTGPGRRVPVSRRSGLVPRWSHDGNEIFFLDGPTLMAAALDIGTGIAVSTVTPLFDISGQGYDVFPGDSLFAAMMPLADGPLRKRELNIIHNIDVLLSRLEGSGR